MFQQPARSFQEVVGQFDRFRPELVQHLFAGVLALLILFDGEKIFRRAGAKLAQLLGIDIEAARRLRRRADQRKELERLCRYITRPAIANERVKLNRAGQVVLQLKSPYKDGTTHVVMEPLEFMERLAAP